MASRLQLASNWLSLLCSVVTIAFVVWRGGEMAQAVTQHESRISNLETRGSASTQVHAQMDEQRDLALADRLRKVEEAIAKIPEMSSDVRVIRAQLDQLREELRQRKTLTGGQP